MSDPPPPLGLTGRELDIDAATLSFAFTLGDDHYRETFALDRPIDPVVAPDHPTIEHLLDVAHLCVGVSYYKLTMPGRVRSPKPLHPTIEALVPHIYDHGLRELAVHNGLPVPLPIVLDAPSGEVPEPPAAPPAAGDRRGPLVPFGGGKDSTLTLTILDDPTLLSVHATAVQRRVARAAGVDLLEVDRRLDPLLATRTAEGGLNGHIPITAINSSVAAVLAAVRGHSEVVIANERSAEEPTQFVGDVPVNHQHSKSFAFERVLAAALRPGGVDYFSLVRRYSELAIAGALAPHVELRRTILSCNRAFSLTRSQDDPTWCLDCAKCRFTFLAFAVFLDPTEARDMFGGNLLDDPAQVEGVRALWTDKPFDCVGELAESAIALAHLSERAEWRDAAVVHALAEEAKTFAAASGTTLEALLAPSGADAVPERLRVRLARAFGGVTDAAH
jgi:hypothetical protein